MKLFKINYLEDEDDGSYLTVGTDMDTSETIRQRELDKRDWDSLYILTAMEITEVDGYPIEVKAYKKGKGS